MKKVVLDNTPLDFSKFMKKFQEIEAKKGKVVFEKPDLNKLTPQQEYVKKYDEKAINRIFFKKNG